MLSLEQSNYEHFRILSYFPMIPYKFIKINSKNKEQLFFTASSNIISSKNKLA